MSFIEWDDPAVEDLFRNIRAQGWEANKCDLHFHPFPQGIYAEKWQYSSVRGNEDAASEGKTIEECLERFLRGDFTGHGQFIGKVQVEGTS